MLEVHLVLAPRRSPPLSPGLTRCGERHFAGHVPGLTGLLLDPVQQQLLCPVLFVSPSHPR